MARRGERRQQREIDPLEVEWAGESVFPLFMGGDKFYFHVGFLST
jgi:hypothetical protein